MDEFTKEGSGAVCTLLYLLAIARFLGGTLSMPYKGRLTALVSKGYFPKELPSAFTTQSFGLHVNEILKDWRTSSVFTVNVKAGGKVPTKNKFKKNSYLYSIDHAEIEIISKPKRGFERRNIHITHPVPQVLLSYEMARNWKTIQKWLTRQTFSLDEIRISQTYERSIKGINFAIHRAKKGYLEATSDWLVKTDISRFYPTIYTHSIAWAAYGKERVKQNLGLYKGSLADRLDLLVRSCNRNQTIGIPIGPETSRIIAEVISSRIDSDFQNILKDIPKDRVDRLQDDWFVGVNTLEKAEAVLSAINATYRDYGLEINGSKTSIERVIGSPQNSWIGEIGAFLSHKAGPIRSGRLREFLSLSLRLQADFPNEPVINYALSIIENQPAILLGQAVTADIETLESFLLKAALVSPISMDRICRIILNLQHRTKRVSTERIAKRFTLLAERNLEKGNLYEVIWLTYTLRGLKVRLCSKQISELIETTPSSALALILLDMKSKGQFLRALPINKWSQQLTVDRVKSDWIWLLGYEGVRHGWLQDPHGVMASPFFHAMASRKVAFYDPSKNVESSAKVARTKVQSRKAQFADVLKFIHVLRGVKFEDY